jgi:acyl transferase domain-containing protein/thioesterase domain-containing protein/acyl carrier protein
MSIEEPIEPNSDIAIIGFAARFPGAENVEQFWGNLCNGVESIRTFSAAQLSSIGISQSLLQNPDFVRAGAPLAHLDEFDAGFFGINPREAAIMDPQQRLFLESVWQALEHAGYAPGTFVGSTGVFAGSGANSYLIHNLLHEPDLVEKDGIFLLRHTGNDKDVLATRVSYQMDLQGPSLNIQTTCSTSLVAVHLACQSLLHYDCDMVVAGASSIEIPHAIGYLYRQNEIQSRDGHCRAFDAKASGTVFGSGVGVVILRRLSDALDDGDTIHAIIKGSAVNNDGSRKVGFFAPSVEGQVDVISEALAVADVEPSSIGYVETHGTGTPIGDPIELTALDQVFSDRQDRLKVGSVKTNIGHLDTASGMAGLIKTVLALGRHQIPPTLHFEKLNPLVDAERTRLQVVDRLTDWKSDGAPRRAGVTSLGIGGTNAHIVLEEPPVTESGPPGRPVRLITLSAKSAPALEQATQELASYLRQEPELNLHDMTYTLHVGRKEFAHRRMFIARDRPEALELADLPNASSVVTAKMSKAHSVAFLFSGQGSQYCDMGRQLYGIEPVFKQWIDTCAALAEPHLGFDFLTILYPAKEDAPRAAEEIKLTWNAQPILFAVEYALAQLWMHWGCRPTRLIGHSLGEYPAACLSGIFSLEDAVSLVCARGNLMRKVGAGAMTAVALSEQEILPWITGTLSLAAVNSEKQCVVSGPTAEIDTLEEKLKDAGIAAARLETSHAFHSSSLDPVLDVFTNLVAQKKLHAPQIPLVSNVTGTWLTEQEATDPAYWTRHFRQTVRFRQGLDALRAAPESLFLEIGPGETLAGLGRDCGAPDGPESIFASLPRPRQKNSDYATMLTALGHLWINGIVVDWEAFHDIENRKRIPLPTYPFQRKRYWIGPKNGSNWIADGLGKVDDWFYRAVWKGTAPSSPIASTEPLLVLLDASEESQALLDELRLQQVQVITVMAGDHFQAAGETSYVMNLALESDYLLLWDRLEQRRQVPRQIAHLWGLNPVAGANEDRCFHSLLYLLRTLNARRPDHPFAITAFSRRSVSVIGEQVLHPYGSLLTGPCRVAPVEHPSLHCRQVDVDTTDPKALAQCILREGELGNDSNIPFRLVAYRGGKRWHEDVERAQLQPVADRVREHGTYLITGGLGGLGMAAADWLARTYQAKLVLLSRQANTATALYEARFAEWRKLGAEVLTLSADVTDRESLRKAIAAAQEKFGPINGIIHAAGVLNDGIIQLKKRETAHQVLAPKTEGLQILDELTAAQPLDFFALFSSVSALAPPDGQVDYCAANAFLQAYAQSRPLDRNFLVIGWGPWGETGMVAPKAKASPAGVPFDHPLLQRVELDTAQRTVYTGTLGVDSHWVLGQHRFHGGDSLLPGTAHIEIAVSALWKKLGRQPISLEDVIFLAPLRVPPDRPVEVHAKLEKEGSGYQFSVTARDVVYVSGFCRPVPDLPPKFSLKQVQARCTLERREAPANVRQRGHFDFGARWQSLRHLAFGRDECLGTLELPAEYRGETQTFALHPALMDIATGVAMYLIPGYDKPGDLLLPFAYKRLTVYGPMPARIYSHARMHRGVRADLVMFDVTLADEQGNVIAEVSEFTIKRLRDVADVAQLEATSVPFAEAGIEPGGAATGIPTREGLEALERMLKCRPSEMIFVSPANLSPVSPAGDAESLSASVNPEADDIEQVLGQLWQRLLGLEEVNASTDFFDSGGHSLLAVRLFTEIRKRFNIDFGLSTLFEARTVGALTDLIRKAREADAGPKTTSTIAHTLVPIRGRESKTPLFLIHDVGGSVLRYESLARNFPEYQSIYAIESRGLSGLPTDFTVETMARHYITQIRERQPHGPYFVAGHSFGGLVTYEIARQLSAQGETMGLVGLLDTYQRSLTPEDEAAHAAQPRRTDKLPFFKRLVKDVKAQFTGRDRIGYLRERRTYIQAYLVKTAYRAAFKVSTRLRLPMPPFLHDVKEANWIAADYFTPGTYDGTVVLFRCQNRLDIDPPDSSKIWQRLVKKVIILDVPGDHNTMLREPGVRVLASQMLNYLKPQAAADKPRA